MTYPEVLRYHNKIGLIAPAGDISPERVTKAVHELEEMGFRPVVGKHVHKKVRYFAGTDEERARDVNEMFEDPEIKGIICLRGGYGSGRILPYLNLAKIKANPKFFLGYSDVTLLHLFLNQQAELITFHGPMAGVELIDEQTDIKTLISLEKHLFFNQAAPTLQSRGVKTLVKGDFSGQLVGGNLTSVVSSLGTPYEIQTAGKVLFLEEVGEASYRIDRLLTQLQQNKKLEKLQGIVLGHFTQVGDEYLEEVFQDIMGNLNTPCIHNYPAGHALPNYTLPMGEVVHYKAQAQGRG